MFRRWQIEEPKYFCGIYSISSPSGHLYIGSSRYINKRWANHKYSLNSQTHHNKILQNAWNKYNGNLEFKLLLICKPQDLIMYEQQFLDFYKPYYNILKIADRPTGIKASPETREKVRKSLLGNKRAAGIRKIPVSLNHRKNLSMAGMGHTVSLETRQKISEAFKKRREYRMSAHV